MLSDRKMMILKAIIENYIDTAEPVGSKSLMASFDRPISSATIRNEMSELEEMGLLEKQHVSSGRVPSAAAYRLYVDQLMDRYRIAALELERMRREMELRLSEMNGILVRASRLLSAVTDHTAVALSTRSAGEQVRRVELIPMDQTGETYALVVIGESTVRNKVLRPEQPVPTESVSVLTGLINMALSEDRLDTLPMLITASFGDGSAFTALAREVLAFIDESSAGREVHELYLEGASKLLRNREYQDTHKAGLLLDHLADPETVRELVNGGVPGQINIRIGPENEDPAMQDASFIFTTYKLGGGNQGVIGIVAPQRMDYARASARLAAFVRTLNDLQQTNNKGPGEHNEP
jgi:heat-inducible transcriptional repressor